MTDEQFDALESLAGKVSDAEVSRDICELIVNEAQTENPATEEAYFAYLHIRVLALGLLDRLRGEVESLQAVYNEFEKALK